MDRYTRVLMGAIDLANIIVPDKTMETAVDFATRKHLFKEGLNYGYKK